MTLSRRRFLTISAGFALAPLGAFAQTWQVRAFGADVTLTIRGASEPAKAALTEALRVIRHVESLFSLYDHTSALSQLNAKGKLLKPAPQFLDLMHAANDAYAITAGLFDPTVQPLWTALASGVDPKVALDAVGWERVQFDTNEIRLGKGQALTLNGIAQGFATDLVTDVLSAHGLENALVNIGEYRSLGGPWRLALSDPNHGDLGVRTLRGSAIATSSPAATPLGTNGHILHQSALPKWSSVSVEASSATLADSLSTAMVLASREEIEAMREQVAFSRITLVDQSGDLITL